MKRIMVARVYSSDISWKCTPQVIIQCIGYQFDAMDENMQRDMISRSIELLISQIESVHHIEVETLIINSGDKLQEKKINYFDIWK